MTVRVRFAPSPTGYLHIGGVRTALFNWLFARHNQGVFILRIEDTDKERSTDESIQQILDGMDWVALDWDEGPGHKLNAVQQGDHGPYRQTQRADIYAKYAQQLLASGHLYRCYCTAAQLEQQRVAAAAAKKTFRYNGMCRDLASPQNKPFTLRLRIPQSGEVIVEDIVRGAVKFQNHDLDDWICVRSDGSPTYNFCVVVDDVTMGITHVIRGDDHLNNTPKQIHLFHALKFPLPKFAHLPMILGQDRKGKLSKREGAASILELRDMGLLPAAVQNYLARLCWSSGDQEIFTTAELIEKFSLEGINKSAAAFDHNKLLWVNAEHLKKLSNDEILKLAQPFFQAQGIELESSPRTLEMIQLFRERCKTFVELVNSTRFLFQQPIMDTAAVAKFLQPQIAEPLREFIAALEKSQTWNEATLKPLVQAILQKYDLKMVALAQAIRVALTGSTVSPPIFDVLHLLGREKALPRLKSISILQ